MSSSEKPPKKDRRRRRRPGAAPRLSKLAERAEEADGWIPQKHHEDSLSGRVEGVEYEADWDETDYDEVDALDATQPPESKTLLLPSDLPAEPQNDPDPSTAHLLETKAPTVQEGRQARVRNVVGVCFSPGGRTYQYESGSQDYSVGDDIVVESDTGPRVGKIVVAPTRQAISRQSVKRTLRAPNSADRANLASRSNAAEAALQRARDKAKELAMDLRIFHAEHSFVGKKLTLYVSSSEKLETDSVASLLDMSFDGRVDIRQVGVRDQAKMIGGVGSCGQPLCCTTWLPTFAPVSIRNAKDQGLVLNPSKVSGQCGRLKCCLVYEHKQYAEIRKRLPKLGKQVVTTDGEEGRVLELDVLHEMVKVGFRQGQPKLVPASQLRRKHPKVDDQEQKKPKKHHE